MKKYYLIVDEEFVPYIATAWETDQKTMLIDEYGYLYLYRKTPLKRMLDFKGVEVIAEWEEEEL